jgi:succinate dehydrogenase / fumarate reductase cytochrome b subunit
MLAVDSYLKSSIGKKQIVAASSLVLILFVIGHLFGNLWIYGGPQAFNGYAEKLAHLRPALNVFEAILLLIFLIHIHVTSLLVLENIRARSRGYLVQKTKMNRSLSSRLMPYTGTIILAFVIWHIKDFTFTDHLGPRSMIHGKSLGLYGVVYNSFTNPVHSLLYIIAIICVGFHLDHGVQSFCQTFGLNHPKYTPMLYKFSRMFAIIITLGFCSIPIYVFIDFMRV